ncbi:MAG: phosphate signaling complex protein PhoU [Hyphomicrobiaceae bacterium]
MNEHTITAYREELALLDRKIAHMGGLAEYNLGKAFDSLVHRDPDLAGKVISADAEIDNLQREIEEQVIVMIARRQPLADDLRQIMASLKIAGDLERIGDLAKNIAKRAQAIADENYPRPLMTGMQHMLERALSQLKDVLDAYSERNSDLALAVWSRDEQLDETYNSVFRELLTYMMEDPRNIGFCTHLLFGAKNLERIGDHTTNIAEIIHYVVHGEEMTASRPKGDTTSSMLFSPK